VAYSPDGRYLASAGRDGWVYLVKAPNGEIVRQFRHGGDARQVAFSPDGRWLASGAWNGTVKLLDLTRTDAEPVLYHLHGGDIRSLAFSPDGRQLACSARRRGVVVLATDSGHQQFTLPEDLGVLSLAFRPDGRCLATAGENLRVKVWDLTAPEDPRNFVGHDKGYVYSLAISPDRQPPQQQVAVPGAFNPSFNRPATTLRLVPLTQEKPVREFAGHKGSLSSVAFRPDGWQLATGSLDRTARLWDVATGQQGPELKHDGEVTGVAYSPEGNFLATSCMDGQSRLWNVTDGQLLSTFAGHDGGVTGIAFVAGGRCLVSAGMDRTIRVWEVATGRALGEYGQHARALTTVVANGDGTLLASADLDQVLWLWQVSADGALTPVHGPIRHGVPAIEEKLAVLGGSRRGFTSLAFSPDGRRLASVSPDRPVQLWDVMTGREVLTLADTPEGPLCVTFSPDGRRLVLSAYAGRVVVWDTEFLDPKARAQAAEKRAVDWHWAQAESADKDKAWFAKIFHTSQGIAAGARESNWYDYRGQAYATLGQWDKARADFDQATQLSPEVPQFWYHRAILRLAAGDPAAYHDACAQMLQHFDRNPGADLNCLYACAPDPKGGGNPAQLVALCRAAVEAQKAALEKTGRDHKEAPGAARRSYGVALRAYGAALYRAGQAQEAIATLEQARPYFAPRAWDRLFLALACQDCGETDKAREVFNQAVQEIKAAGQAERKGSQWFHWQEQVEVEALQREAATKLGVKR
jgi:WD40 repeat protein